MYLENLRVDAVQALDWGLIAEVVPAAEVRERAHSLALRLAAGPTRAFGYQRRLLRETWAHTLSDQLRLETEGVAATGGTRDAEAAIEAFLGKRRPAFEGR
jgi:2-(1,2-epoxy-1,2-dihydrophenyl)acetyl-CoA isomerase